MEDAQLLARHQVSLRRFVTAFATCSEQGHVVEHDGVWASVQPEVGQASLFNSVAYASADRLEAALPELTAHYDEAGVAAWTVWVHESDARAIESLAAAGHVQDSQPMTMGLDLGDLEDRGDAGSLDVDREPAIADLLAVIAPAYGMPPPMCAAAMSRLPDSFRPYLARVDGRPASCLFVSTADGDALVEVVGTIPEARGQSLSRRLLTLALLDEARERGAQTSTLRASAMGHPVYARMGYRDLGPTYMYEKRRAA